MTAASFQLAYTEQAKQSIASLDGSIQKQLRKILERKLAVSPRQHGKPLAGKLAGFWSHRFAMHRVIYRVCEDLQLVVVCAVGSRREGHGADIYRQFQAIVDAGRAAKEVLDVLEGLPDNKPDKK